jgi:hypothetical protein
VARKSRSSAGSSHESSPSASPSSSPASRGGNEDRIERPASARNDCAHRTGAKGAGPRRSASSTSSSAEIPRRSRNWANPPSSTGRIEPVTRRTSPRTAVGGASRPESHTVSRTDAVPSSHATAPTSRIADHRSSSDAGSVRSEPSTVTFAGAMRATTAPWTRCSCTVPHPTDYVSRRACATQQTASGTGSWAGGEFPACYSAALSAADEFPGLFAFRRGSNDVDAKARGGEVQNRGEVRLGPSDD